MTSVSSASSFQHVRTSPRERLQNELTSEVSSGKIGSGDQDALSSALDSIDQALTSERSSDTSGQRLSPQDMKKKIDGLIDQQTTSGALTADQANELKQVFQNTFGKGHHGGHGGVGGPPPGPPPSDPSSQNDSSSSNATAQSTDATSSSSDISSLVQDFLKQLQENLSKSTSYGADGSKPSSTTIALLINQTA